MCSDKFDKFTRLKSRKSFIKASESAYNVTHLRPKYRNVILTDATEVMIPVFDARTIGVTSIKNQNFIDNVFNRNSGVEFVRIAYQSLP